MKLALFGATGGTGQQILVQALAAGHTITALVRDATKLAAQSGLTIVPGNVLDPAAVAQTVQGVEAVICTLGGTANNPRTVVSAGTNNIVQAMGAQGVRRLIVISSLGVGDSKNQVPFFFKIVAATVLRRAMQEKETQEAIVRASGLDWIIVRPGGLNDGPRTGTYRSGLDRTIVAGMVARADVADFVLKQLTDERYVHQTPAVT
jgi:putative NADH-flavin reductase